MKPKSGLKLTSVEDVICYITYLLISGWRAKAVQKNNRVRVVEVGGWVPAPPPAPLIFSPTGWRHRGLTPALALALLYVSKIRYKNATWHCRRRWLFSRCKI